MCLPTTSCRYLAPVYQKSTLIVIRLIVIVVASCCCCWLLQLMDAVWGPGLLNGVSRIIEGTGKIYQSSLPGKLKEIKKPVPIKHTPSLFFANLVPQFSQLLRPGDLNEWLGSFDRLHPGPPSFRLRSARPSCNILMRSICISLIYYSSNLSVW